MDHFIDMMRFWNWDYLSLLEFIIAIGAIVMVLLQLIDLLTPIRAIYHTWLLRRWIDDRVKLHEDARGGQPSATTESALAQLIANATGGHARALLGLAAPQLTAQINAAAQAALENPEPNYSLIAVLSQPTNPQIPLVLRSGPPTGPIAAHMDDLSILLQPPQPQEEQAVTRYLEARTRIAHRIQRNLDGLQITLGNGSGLLTQILAILISIVICSVIVINTRAPGHTYVLTVVLLGITAGYVAPLLGDLATAVRRLGQP